jgi:A/G-specific adenine glycosylase
MTVSGGEAPYTCTMSTTVALNPDKIDFLRDRLLTWFRANQRELPWRQTRDPYKILVSEVMLQQTQVDRVIPYYQAFLERFPTEQSLAEAPTAEVIRVWAGLGYNRRAVNLQRTAQYVVSELGGEFPKSVEELRKLPGVGPYTAGAIACFAFEQDVPFFDTNMRRVLHRYWFGVDVPRPTASDREISLVAAEAVPPGSGWEWNQALIEFGAMQCTARKPACVICPLQQGCAAFPEIQSALAELPKGVRLKREAPYSGSNRFYRGRVIAALREHPSEITLPALGPRVREGFTETDLPWLFEVVQGLSRDGLAVIAEDTTPYDPGADATANDVKVRLP